MDCNLTWMVSGSRVREVSGMKVTSSAARSAITPNTTSGTWAPYTRSSTMKGAIWQERSSLPLYSATVPVSHHGPDPRPEGAAAEAGCPHHGGEDLGGVDVADGEGVDSGHSARQVQNKDGPLVCKL